MGHSVPLGKYLVGFLLAVLFQEGAGDNIARYPPSKPTTTGQVWLRYCRGIESIFELNFCDMLPCGTRMDRVYQAEKYMCLSTRRDGSYMRGYSCEEWSQASWLTHPGYKEGYYPLWSSYKEIQKGISLTRRLYGYKEVWSNNGLAVKGESIFIKLRADLLIPENRSHKTDKGLVFLMLRADTYGEDLKVVIHLSGVACGPNKCPSRGTYDSLGAPHLSPPPVVHPNGGTHEEYWEVKTGELDQNMWLKWMNYTARAQGKTNCIICAAGRPSLTTAPARITPHNSPQGFVCLLELFVDGHIPGCSIAIKSRLNNMYPQTPIRSIPPRFEVNLTPDYHCITGRGTGRKVGSFPLDSCNTTREIKLLSNMTHARSDIWWFCGGQILRGVLPFEFSGTCAIIQLIMPIYILPDSKTVMDLTLSSSGGLPDLTRRKREYAPVPGSFDKNIYIDTIGVPRGVPNEHKARNQIAAGFESVLFWWSTINKNVDWINYIYYNQQRFVNFTEEAVKGLSEQFWSMQAGSAVKTAQKRLYFLRRLKKFGMSSKTLTNFYRCTIESILSGCITAWYGSCSAADRKALQRVVKTAERITGSHLPSVQGIYNSRCLRKAKKILKDNSHPGYGLFSLLPSGRRYRSIRTRTTRLTNSFFPLAVRLLNQKH
uniref:Alkylated DNA repair protein AlkB homologue 8 N-terminal domain-containing protein n=1 Tax=Gadus morhua TaxID=8049 RepID=A0A8C5BDP5_GADMO